MYAIICHNSNGILIACDGIGLSDFKHIVQVDDGLRNSVIVVIHAVSEFTIIVQHKPSSLPSFGSIHWIGKVPIRCHKQITTFGHNSSGLVDFQRFIRVLVFITVAIGTFVLRNNKMVPVEEMTD